jgi:hypothetical protein
MSHSDATSDEETETSHYMSSRDGVSNKKLEITSTVPSQAHSDAPSNREGKEL